MVDQAEIHRKVLSDRLEERNDALFQICTDFVHISDKDQAWNDLIYLITKDKYRYIPHWIRPLSVAIPHVPNKEQVWMDILKLTKDEDGCVRYRAVQVLKMAHSQISNKEPVCNDLIQLTKNKEGYIRQNAINALNDIFSQVKDSDKERICRCLLDLIKDRDVSVGGTAAKAIGSVFPYVSNKVQLWEDLCSLSMDRDTELRTRATKSLGLAFPYIPDKVQAWNYLFNYDVKRIIIRSFKYNLHYAPDKELVWNDLIVLTNESEDVAALGAVEALGIVFPYVSDKDRAWRDLLNLVKYKHGNLQRMSIDVLINAFPYVHHKEKASDDLLNLTKHSNRANTVPSWWPKSTTGERMYVIRKALEGLKYAFVYIPEKDKVQAWEHVFNLTKNSDGKLRLEALEVLGYAFPHHPDKKSAWSDLRSIFQEDRDAVRLGAIELFQNTNHITPCEIANILSLVFPYIPNKKQAWDDLYKLTKDKDENVRWCAVEALSATFLYAPDKEQKAWNVLLNLIKDENRYVRANATKALGLVFPYVLNKEQAWKYLDELIKDRDDLIQLSAVEALEPAFSHIPDKKQAGKHLHRLAYNEVVYLRLRAVKVIGAAYPYIIDKEQAWTDMLNLSKDSNSEVKASANYSLGRASIIKATEAETEEKFRIELEKALGFFEKSAKEIAYSNPAKFCHPFYRSFYVLTFKKEDVEAEVEKYLSEAKSASSGSKSKEELLEAIENLANALKEAEKARDLGAMKCDLDAYKRYCEQAGELLNDTEEKAPGATKVIRKGLPVIDRRIKDLLEEIRDESDNICKTAGPKESEIGCEVRKHTTAALATDNPIEVQKNVNYIAREIDQWSDLISDTREREYIKSNLLSIQEKDTIVQLTMIRDMMEEIKRMSKKIDQINKKVDGIVTDVGELRRMIPARFDAILSRFDKTEKIIIESVVGQILEQFDQDERTRIGLVLEAIKVDPVPETLLRETLDAVQQALVEIRQQNLVFHETLTSRDFDLFSNVVNETRLDVADQLILNVPIIPYVLSYQHQVGLKSGIKLGAAWRNLVKWAQGHRSPTI